MGTPRIIQLPRSKWDEILRHALNTAPNEAVGILGLKGDDVMCVCPGLNVSDTPSIQFVMDVEDQIRITNEIQIMGWVAGVVYHTHPTASAVLSAEDFKFARPDLLHMVIGMRHGMEAKIWSIDHRGTYEIRVEVK